MRALLAPERKQAARAGTDAASAAAAASPPSLGAAVRPLAEGRARWLREGQALAHGPAQQAWLDRLLRLCAGRWVAATEAPSAGLRLGVLDDGRPLGTLVLDGTRVAWVPAEGPPWTAELPADVLTALAAQARGW